MQKFTENSFMSINVIVQIHDQTLRITERIRQSGTTIFINNIPTRLGMAVFAHHSLFTLIEENIAVLANVTNQRANIEPTRMWHGELDDIPRFCYKDVNRWFESLDIIEKSIS